MAFNDQPYYPREEALLRRRENERSRPFDPRPETPAEIPDPPPADPSSDQRYNPFDLGLYADWIREDPSVTTKALTKGEGDPYVQLRIIQRLRDPRVRDSLPAVVLLERFDRALLLPALGLDDEDAAVVWRELAAQEWIEAQHDEVLRTLFLTVDRNLLPRLRASLIDPTPGAAVAVCSRLAGPLVELVRSRQLCDLGVDHVRAALRLLDPTTAAEVWEQAERRIGTEADWVWARDVCGRLLGDPVISTGPLRGALLIAQLAALTRLQPDAADLAEAWLSAGIAAQAHPDRRTATWLVMRARIGSLIASLRWGRPPTQDLFLATCDSIKQVFASPPHDESARWRQAQAAASATALLEALTEWGEAADDATYDTLPWQEWPPGELGVGPLTALTDEAYPGLAACMRSLRARCMLRWSAATTRPAGPPTTGDPEGSQREGSWSRRGGGGSFGLSELTAAAETTPADTGGIWHDWTPPGHLGDRLRLELVRVQLTRLQHVAQSTAGSSGIDGDRLTAALLMARLDAGLVPLNELMPLQTRILMGSATPLCNAHHTVPPLGAAVVRGLAALGVDSLRFATTATSAAAELPQSDERALFAERLDGLRRMRSRHVMRLISSGGMPSGGNQVQGRETMAVIFGTAMNHLGDLRQQLASRATSATRHDWWRGIIVLSVAGVASAKSCGAELQRSAAETATQPDDLLDLAELALLAGQRPRLPTMPDALADHGDARLHLRRCLRTYALSDESAEPAGLRASHVLRQAAEAARTEGELLALRLPVRALRLHDLASELFAQAGDPVGGFLATIGGTIAACFADDVPDARRRLDDLVRPAYERLVQRSEGPPLPSWDDLRTAAADSTQHPVHPDWQGWLDRLIACIMALDLDPASWKAGTQWQGWLQAHFSADFDTLSPEIALLPRVARVTAGQVSTPPASASRAAGWIATGAVLTVLIGGFFLFRLAHEGIWGASPWWVVLIVYLLFWPAFGMLLLAVRWVRPRVTAWMAAQIDVALVLRTAATPSSTSKNADEVFDAAAEVPVAVRRRLAARLGAPMALMDLTSMRLLTITALAMRWLVPSRFVHDERYALVTPGLLTYADAAPLLPRPLADQFRRVQRMLRGALPSATADEPLAGPAPLPANRRSDVALFVELDLAPWPWEALLLLTSPWPGERISATLGAYRSIAGTQGEPIALESVLCLVSTTWWSRVEPAWQRRQRLRVVRHDREQASAAAGSPSMVHLVGRPLTRGRHLRLRIDGGGQEERSLKIQKKSSAPEERGLLVAPGEIPAALIIIQAEPAELVGDRFDSDREQAMTLRAFASAYALAGPQAVVMVPALPPALADAVLRTLVTGLGTHLRRQPLFDTIAAMRQLIVDSAPPADRGATSATGDATTSSPTADALRELALDITVFWREPPPADFAVDPASAATSPPPAPSPESA